MKLTSTAIPYGVSAGHRGVDPVLYLWVALNGLDAALTWHLLSLGGVEANPLLRLIEAYVGPAGMLTFKMSIASLVGLIIATRRTNSILKLASAMMVGVVIYNAALAISVRSPIALF